MYKISHELLDLLYTNGFPCAFTYEGEKIEGRTWLDENVMFAPDADTAARKLLSSEICVYVPNKNDSDSPYSAYVVDVNQVTFKDAEMGNIFRLYGKISDAPDDWNIGIGSLGVLSNKTMQEMIVLYLKNKQRYSSHE